MFTNDIFDVYDFETVPLNTDLFLMDKKYMKEWADCLSVKKGRGIEKIGYINYIAARTVHSETLELSWYPNIFTRFHEVIVFLPKDQFVACVGAWSCDEKTHVFVESSWLESLHKRTYAMFGYIDAIGMKKALKNNAVSQDRLQALRSGIDLLAKEYPEVAFISFADSIILKSTWSAEYVRKDAPQSYSPEMYIEIFQKCNALYKAKLGLDTYAVFTQGSNEYYSDRLLHISELGNHVSLNSLGTPFAQLFEISSDAERHCKEAQRKDANLYIDNHFFHSLQLNQTFKDTTPQAQYESRIMKREMKYRYVNCNSLLAARNIKG